MSATPWHLVSDTQALAEARGWNYTAFAPPTRQWRESSRTTQAGMEQLLRDPAALHGAHYHAEKSGIEKALHYFARLYGPSSYLLPQAFVCEVPGAFQNLHGTVVTSQREILLESHSFNWRDSRYSFIRNVTPSPPLLSGRWFSLGTIYPGNYAHWLMDLLPLTVALDHVEGDVSLLLPATPGRLHAESIHLLGLDHLPRRALPERFVQVERLIFAHATTRSGKPRREHLVAVRDRLRRGAQAEPAPTRRIYISRARAARRVVNESDLEAILTRRGFEIVRCEELTLTEQVRLFSQARIVVGPHGAGMINQIFVPEGGEIVEFFNPGFWHENNATLSSLLGQRHWHLFGQNLSPKYDMKVDPEACEALLDLVLDSGGFQ